ncbi:hypothetical protein [Neopusillimonas aromaticivorans]|uniref:hypothetical protein n=1 Tax=Neopusillimonas aromaticivorans TaxID=2979868 RepID=UPI002594544B|nr:hypothetical protein [Neopusillimonas aromaticivorans]WJJ93246.1 hypothetical protein N7E01_14690 [Neopusillimonas aromaticivorans]
MKDHTPHGDNPHYQLGDFAYLLNLLGSRIDARAEKMLAIIAHPNGHAASTDLELLFKDAHQNGYKATLSWLKGI